MDFKKKIANVTMDKRDLQRQSLQIKKSLDEVQKIIGAGKQSQKKK